MNTEITLPTHPDWLTEEAFQVLGAGYMLPGEVPRDMWKRCATTAEKYLKIPGIGDDIMEMFWEGYLGGASPVLSNFGTSRGLPISCLETGTRVHTKDGFKEIQDLEVGDLVLTHMGRWRKVLNKWSRPTNKDLYKLSVGSRGNYELNITGNHPVLTNMGWVPVEELNPQVHQIAVEPITHVFRRRNKRKVFDFKVGSERYNSGSSQLEKNPGCFKVKELPNCYLDQDLAWWLGLWFAEGHTSDNGTIGISMGWSEEHLLDRWLKIAEDKLGLKGTKSIYANGRGHQHAQARIHNKYLQNFFDREFGKGCKVKVLPDWVFDLPDSTLKALVEGFSVGDGAFRGDGVVNIGIANEKLCYQLWYIMSSLGKFPSIRRSFQGYHKDKNSPEELNYSEHGCFWLYTPKEFPSGYGLSRTFTVEKQDRETTVWDIEVEEDHSFVAQGVVVHNCYSTHISDNVPSIFSHLKEVASLSKYGGGVGVYFGDVRPSGSPISGGGKSTGIVPWMRQYDLTASVVSQGSTRRGSFALYLPIDHPDLGEALRSKDHSKGDPRKFIDSNLAVVIKDKWLEEMMAGDKDKQKIFAEVLRCRMTSGSPYLIFIDNANNQRPDCFKQRNLEIFTSNLCFTGDTKVVLANGECVEIKELVDSDRFEVWSGELGGDKWYPQVQKAIAIKTGVKEVIKLKLSNGQTISCTPNHKLAKPNGTYVEAEHSIGCHLSEMSGNDLQVLEIESLGIQDVYNLNVEVNNNFYISVGEEKILVKNCSEIFLPTDENHTFVCVLSSLNLAKYDEWRHWTGKNTGKTAPELAIYFLDAVVEEFIHKAERLNSMGRAVRFAKKSRALGLGTMGKHALYQSRGLAFDSQAARDLNKEAHRWIDEMTLKASREMAVEFGEPEWCEGNGVRHATRLAIAPTKTNSVICGAVSEGIEPLTANLFVAGNDKGTFVRKNPYLEKHLESIGKNTKEVWDSILEERGSVQHLEFLSPHAKNVFKTAREIDQFEIVKQNADTQKYVCQGISTNLFVDPEAPAQTIMALHLLAWKLGLKSLYYLKSSSLQVKKSKNLPSKRVTKPAALVITKPDCPWCVKAKDLLNSKGYVVQEQDRSTIPDSEWPYKTVPQIWIDGEHVEGGFEGLQKFLSPDSEEKYADCVACQG